MIAWLEGVVISKGGDNLILSTNGVGYELSVPTRDVSRLALGDTQAFFVAEQIREDAHDLYGYATPEERSLHVKLIGVQGVGPKLAHAILSVYDAPTLTEVIEQEDLGRLNVVPGVGKKTAQRMLLDLKGKLVGVVGVSTPGSSDDPAVAALIHLGFQRDHALESLKHVDPAVETAERVRQALKGIR